MGPSKIIYYVAESPVNFVATQWPPPEWVYVGPLVLSGFLTMCRENFTSPGDYKDALIKTGNSETREGLAQKKLQETLSWAASDHWEVRERGALVTAPRD